MKIPAFELSSHIPHNPDSVIQVLYANSGRAAFNASPAGIRVMAAHDMVDGVIASRPAYYDKKVPLRWV
jgi:hypothetical protein